MLIWLPFLCLLLHLKGSPSISLLLDVLTQISQSVVAPTSGLLDVSQLASSGRKKEDPSALFSLKLPQSLSHIHNIQDKISSQILMCMSTTEEPY